LSSNIRETREQVELLRREMKEADNELKKLIDDFHIYVALADETGLPRNFVRATRRVLQLKITFESAYRSAMLFYTATGPIGWITAGAGLALSALMLKDQMEMRRPRY